MTESRSADLQAVAVSIVTQEIEASSSQAGVSFLVLFSPFDRQGLRQPWPALEVMAEYRGAWNSAWAQGSFFTEHDIRMTAREALAGLGLLSS